MENDFKVLAVVGWSLVVALVGAVYVVSGWQWVLIFVVIFGLIDLFVTAGWLVLVSITIYNSIVQARHDAKILRYRASDKDILLAFQLQNLRADQLRVLELLAENEINLRAEDDLIVPGFSQVRQKFLTLFYAMAIDAKNLPAVRDAYIWAKGHIYARGQAEELTNWLITNGFANGSAGEVARWVSGEAAMESLSKLGFRRVDIEQAPSPTASAARNRL